MEKIRPRVDRLLLINMPSCSVVTAAELRDLEVDGRVAFLTGYYYYCC